MLLQLVRVIAHGDAALAPGERAHLADVRASVAPPQWATWVAYAERWLRRQRRARARANRCYCQDPSCAWHAGHPVEHAIATIAARVHSTRGDAGAAKQMAEVMKLSRHGMSCHERRADGRGALR